MRDIKLNEISVVDHPAHMVEGFAVIKAAAGEDNTRALIDALRKETMPKMTVEEILSELSADEIVKALGDKAQEVATLVLPEAEVTVVEDVTKSLSDEQRAEFAKRDEKIAELEAEIEKSRREAIEKGEKLADEQAIAKSRAAYAHLSIEHETVAPALRKFALADEDSAKAITELLEKADKQVGEVFKEIGTSAVTDDESAYGRLSTLAKARAAEKGESFTDALLAVTNDPANAELVAKHYKEEN
jgi:cytochrome c551/c552